MKYAASIPRPMPDAYGFSYQVWLAVHLHERIYGRAKRYAWFSLHFNPAENVDSSDPCVGYYVPLSRAVQQNDVGSRYIRDYRNQLSGFVDEIEDAGVITSLEAATYQQEITNASATLFRPEIWRINLRKIAKRKGVSVADLKLQLGTKGANKIKLPQVLQADEYFIDDLRDNEYNIVIVG